MKQPKITTIIPTFCRPERLKMAIQSVLEQSYQELQIFVCDNASNDGTKDEVMSLMEKDSRIHYYCQPYNVSPYKNWQTGLNYVATPYFNILADDDLILPWFYENAITALEENPSAALFSGGSLVVNDNGQITGAYQLQHEGIWTIRSDFKSASLEGVFPIYGIVYRKILPDGKIFMEFNEELTKYPGYADIGYTWRILVNYPIINTARFCNCYRIHDSNFSLSLSYSQTDFNDVMQVFAKIFDSHLYALNFFSKQADKKRDVMLFRSSVAKIVHGQNVEVNRFVKSRPLFTCLLCALKAVCRFDVVRRVLKNLQRCMKSRRSLAYLDLQAKYGEIVAKYNFQKADESS